MVKESARNFRLTVHNFFSKGYTCLYVYVYVYSKWLN